MLALAEGRSAIAYLDQIRQALRPEVPADGFDADRLSITVRNGDLSANAYPICLGTTGGILYALIPGSAINGMVRVCWQAIYRRA